MKLVSSFVNILLPVFILIGFGVILDRKFSIEIKSLSRVTLYIFSPCLIFTSLTNSTVSGADSARIFAFVIISTLLIGGITYLAGRVSRLEPVTLSALLLTTMFTNSGNYGLSVNLFAFGEAGLERAALFFVGSSLLSNTLGVFVAARGRSDTRKALLGVLKLPVAYAALVALLVNITDLVVPEPLTKAFTIASNGAVPALLLILGMQLSRTSLENDTALIVGASLVRLIMGAVLAWVLAMVMNLQGVTRQVCIVEASMPSAITPLLFAVEYNARPRLVTGVIFLSTLASIITLTVLLSILM